jgi:hypothetical protein
LIGSGTSTGTASQTLQVTGGAAFTGVGASVGIGTTRPISIAHIQVPNLQANGLGGLYLTSSDLIYPNATTNVAHPGIFNNLNLNTSQSVNTGFFLTAYGLRNNLSLTASSTATSLTRLIIRSIDNNISYGSTAPLFQILGINDTISFSGSSLTGSSGCLGTFTLSGISSSTQTASVIITSPTLSATNAGGLTNAIRSLNTWRGYNANLSVGSAGSGIGNTTTITNAEWFTATGAIHQGSTGSVVTITNLYGLRLATPATSGIVTITNN